MPSPSVSPSILPRIPHLRNRKAYAVWSAYALSVLFAAVIIVEVRAGLLFDRQGSRLGFQGVHHGLDFGDRNSIAHALDAGRGELCGVDTDDLARHIEQRTAAVARVDGGVRLDKGRRDRLARAVRAGLDRAVQCADDAGRDRLAVAERVADCNHLLSDPQRGRVAERRDSDFAARAARKQAQRHFHDRNIARRVYAAQLRLVHLVIDKADRERGRTLDNVVIREDIQRIRRFLEDNARTGARRFAQLGAVMAVAVEILLRLLHRNIGDGNHARQCLFRNVCDVGHMDRPAAVRAGVIDRSRPRAAGQRHAEHQA